ncbi:MAG: DUF3084 domain-containing protein [Abditibacteriales bacterium]|nr:DUF3084 domain-containing protein [Abditibacteriales bacterium]MDW8365782.1 DUF3084 domain-containing protein [Abditibacteriales bacterium]
MILFTFVISLGVVCGFIAYVGDYLGKRLGKKRVTLLGLRPRQTAVLVSVTTGVCIFLVAFTGILAASQNARHALLRFDETVRRNKALTAANDELRKANQRLEESRRALAEKARGLQAQVTSVERELRHRVHRLRETARMLQQTGQMLKTVEREYNAVRRKYTEAQVRLKDIQAQLQDAHQTLATTRLELERTQASAMNVGKEFVALGKQVVELEKQRDALEAQRQKLYAEVQEIVEWKTVGLKVVRGKVTIGANEVIASRSIPEGLSAAAVRQELEELLREANRVAEEHGARASATQPRPLILATREFIVGDVRGVIDEDRILDRTAEDIAQRQRSFVVDVVALRNYVEGEPVQAQLVLYPNQMVFREGDPVLSKEVHCAQSKAGLFHDITALLEEARQVAAQQGVLPRKKYAYAEGTNEKVFVLLERLAAQRGHAKVSVIADKNLWTADQLSVRLEISQLVN